MELDRDLQLSILNELKAHYPNAVRVSRLDCCVDDWDFNTNLIYLEEHGLISGESHTERRRSGNWQIMIKAKITAVGLDFLEDDGGLDAILKKVTVKFDSGDLQAIIESRLSNEEIAPETKGEIMGAIKSLPSEGIKMAGSRLLSYTLDKTPDAIGLIQKALGLTV